jgi:putative ATP-dependent endonuclease of OLD family
VTTKPKDRKATIDILINPTGEDGARVDNFPAGSFWTNLWGEGISQTEPEFNDFVAIRTTIEWSNVHGDYRTTRKFLKEWKSFDEWLTSEEKGSVISTQIEPIALQYIDAKRDLEEDLRSRGSFWRRLTEDLGLQESDIKQIEEGLTALNTEIIAKSEVLTYLRETLLEIQNVVAAEKAGVEIAPVPRRLRDLSKGIDVTMSTTGAQSFPLSRHGMGTRSLASLLVFRAFTSWKSSQASKAGDLVHSILALEEPEAHLHPQAQRALFGQIREIPGQRIVSTHSPYFAGQSRLEDLRLLTKVKGDTNVAQLNVSQLDTDDRRKLDREVIASRGDLLFARALILFEGETEEQCLPLFAFSKWGATSHELGFSFVGVGGGNYFPFVWLARHFSIPWYIFSDGEPKAREVLFSQLKRAGCDKPETQTNVFILPDDRSYEAQLLTEGYIDAIEVAIQRALGPGFLDNYITRLDGKPNKKVDGAETVRVYSGEGGRRNAVGDVMRDYKTRLAAPIAQSIIELPDLERRCPKCLDGLFNRLQTDFGLG